MRLSALMPCIETTYPDKDDFYAYWEPALLCSAWTSTDDATLDPLQRSSHSVIEGDMAQTFKKQMGTLMGVVFGRSDTNFSWTESKLERLLQAVPVGRALSMGSSTTDSCDFEGSDSDLGYWASYLDYDSGPRVAQSWPAAIVQSYIVSNWEHQGHYEKVTAFSYNYQNYVLTDPVSLYAEGQLTHTDASIQIFQTCSARKGFTYNFDHVLIPQSPPPPLPFQPLTIPPLQSPPPPPVGPSPRCETYTQREGTDVPGESLLLYGGTSSEFHYTDLTECQTLCTFLEGCLGYVDNYLVEDPYCVLKAAADYSEQSGKDFYQRYTDCSLLPPPPPSRRRLAELLADPLIFAGPWRALSSTKAIHLAVPSPLNRPFRRSILSRRRLQSTGAANSLDVLGEGVDETTLLYFESDANEGGLGVQDAEGRLQEQASISTEDLSFIGDTYSTFQVDYELNFSYPVTSPPSSPLRPPGVPPAPLPEATPSPSAATS